MRLKYKARVTSSPNYKAFIWYVLAAVIITEDLYPGIKHNMAHYLEAREIVTLDSCWFQPRFDSIWWRIQSVFLSTEQFALSTDVRVTK